MRCKTDGVAEAKTMTPLLSPISALLYLVPFGAVMLAATLLFGRRIGSSSIEGFLVANRNVGWFLGGTSIAASWTWAVALMVSVQIAYQQGLAGAFWFTVPNVLAVLLFVWLGPRIREKLPGGYSLPEWINFRLKHRGVAYIYLIVYFYYQVMAVTVQVYAGASLLGAATGLSPLTLNASGFTDYTCLRSDFRHSGIRYHGLSSAYSDAHSRVDSDHFSPVRWAYESDS